ncbi:hypothetical protein FRC17_002246 [Serendipita sp. 399]|nr:hypothetical protein FRC17_002246 [Serendipita sp. 399]
MTSYARPTSMKPVAASQLQQPQPYIRPRAVSSSATGSPHSMRSNIAVVDGPVSGNYYGVYLGEPSIHNRSSSNLSSTSSILGSGSSQGSSLSPRLHHGTPAKVHNQNQGHMRSASSSAVAFPVTVLPAGATRAEPVYIVQTLPQSTAATATATASTRPRHLSTTPQVSQGRRASVAPSPMARQVVVPSAPAGQKQSQQQQQSSPLPSAMKRERRKTMTPSTSSSEELPASALRSLCKFSIGAIGECLKRPANEPMFRRLRKTDDVLGRMYTILFAMSSAADAEMLPASDSTEIATLLQQLQALLYRSLSNRPYNPSRLVELEGLYRTLDNCTNRLDLTFKIKDLEGQINQLTFQHNVSQSTSVEIVKALKSSDPAHRPKRKSEVDQKAQELDAMHAERAGLREQIQRAKARLETMKTQRDALLGIKSVRFE